MIGSTPEERPHYALRLLPRAERDIDAHAERLAILTGPANAQQWHTGLFAHIATLTDNPRRFPHIAEQKRFLKETRHLLYRPKPDGPVSGCPCLACLVHVAGGYGGYARRDPDSCSARGAAPYHPNGGACDGRPGVGET